MTDVLLLGIGVYALDSGDVDRRGHIIDDRVEELLNSLVLIRSTADNRNKQVVYGGFSEGGLKLGNRQLLSLAVLFEKCLVGLGDSLDHLGVVLFSLFAHILRNGLDSHVLAHIVVIYVGFHIHKVDDTSEGILGADRKLDRHGMGFETRLHHVDDTVEVCAHDIHLIDVRHTGYAVLVSLTPYGFRLRLDTALCAENRYRTVKNTQGTLDLNSEVDVSGSVDDVYPVGVFLCLGFIAVELCRSPETGGGGGSYGDTSLLLLRHPVHCCRTFVGLTDLVIDSRIEQDPLGRGGFTRVDMRHDTDVSGSFQWVFSRHGILLKLLLFPV